MVLILKPGSGGFWGPKRTKNTLGMDPGEERKEQHLIGKGEKRRRKRKGVHVAKDEEEGEEEVLGDDELAKGKGK